MLYSADAEVFEINFWNEIWGCVKYIGLPYDTVMNMPIQDRKVWIQKHNIESKNEGKDPNEGNVSGFMINAYAENEQNNMKNMRIKGNSDT